MKAHERIAAGMRANEDWVLGNIARFGAWYYARPLSMPEHNAIDRLVRWGAIKYDPARHGYIRCGGWARPVKRPKPGPKNKSKNL